MLLWLLELARLLERNCRFQSLSRVLLKALHQPGAGVALGLLLLLLRLLLLLLLPLSLRLLRLCQGRRHNRG